MREENYQLLYELLPIQFFTILLKHTCTVLFKNHILLCSLKLLPYSPSSGETTYRSKLFGYGIKMVVLLSPVILRKRTEKEETC